MYGEIVQAKRMRAYIYVIPMVILIFHPRAAGESLHNYDGQTSDISGNTAIQ